jgi:hypothetical protein
MPPVAPSFQEKREALEEVLQSVAFFRAEQLRSFLRYICEMELAGRGDELCESLIGVEAFGRPQGYSPTEDASVRRRAGDLREKLQEVYAGELIGSKVRIELPKGKFVPRFVRAMPEGGLDKELAAILPLEHPSLRHMTERPAAITSPAHVNDSLVAARLDAMLLKKAKAWRRLIVFWFAVGWLVGGVTVAMAFLAYQHLQPSASRSPATQPAGSGSQASPAAAPQTIALTQPQPGSATAIGRQPSLRTPAEPLHATTPAAASKDVQSYEAEDAGNTMNGITEPFPCKWCSGGNRVRNIGRLRRNYLTVNHIVVPKSGRYEMTIYFVLKGQRSFFISVDDGLAVETQLTGKSWDEVSTASITLTLQAGENSIRFFNDHSYAPDLDRVTIRQP